MAVKTLYVRSEDSALWVRAAEEAEAQGLSTSEYVTVLLRERLGEPEERCTACGALARHWAPPTQDSG